MTRSGHQNSLIASIKADDANRSAAGVVPGYIDDLFAVRRKRRGKFIVIGLSALILSLCPEGNGFLYR